MTALCQAIFIVLLLYSIVLFCFQDKISCTQNWPGTHYVANNNPEFVLLLIPPPKC